MTAGTDQSHWLRLGEFLRRDLVLLEERARRSLLGEWERIRDAEQGLDDRLTLGIVGGTGVGKSTLINALAGERISASGDRRPTTDRVVVYRHEDTLLPGVLPPGDIAEPQCVHTSSLLERVIVLDFPDFDSFDALHHEVLERFFPHLDVLVVVVDDVKYGDARLFELLERLPHNHENFYVVLNKIDALRSRYPDRWDDVIRKILADLRSKLQRYAQLTLGEEHFLALSALLAFEHRTRDSSADDGGFQALIGLLSEYRAEQRRRAAKELNIEARQRLLYRAAHEKSAIERDSGRVERAVRLAAAKRQELDRSVAVLGLTVLSSEERRRMASERLERSAQSFGFPIDFMLALKAQIRLRRRRTQRRLDSGLSTARLRRHFRAYLEAVNNSLHDLQLELGGATPGNEPRTDGAARAASAGRAAVDPHDGAPGEDPFLSPVRDFARYLADWEANFKKRWRIWNHVLPGLVVMGCVLSVTQPALEVAAEGWAANGEIGWGGVGRELLVSFVGALSPLFLLSAAVGVAMAYGITALVAWTRQIQRLERVLRKVEESAGAAARAYGDSRLRELEDRMAAWLRERAELEAIVGERQRARVAVD